MQIYAIILAGGIGSRLAPISTPAMPKQFLDLTNSGQSLFQKTLARALEIAAPENVIIVGNILHKNIFDEQLKNSTPIITKNIIFEAETKNTAAAIFLAAQKISQGQLVIMPSDHIISGNFIGTIKHALDAANNKKIVTIGVKPKSPDTNFGYITSAGFHEKPEPFIAEKLIEQGALWNSGIYVAEAEIILEEFQKFHPEFFEKTFADLPKIPFDKAISEKTDKIFCVPALFEWADIGTLEALQKYA